jgi:ribonuclease G
MKGVSMSKELFISASPHETKVAVLEDDLLVEVYHERDTNTGLVGGIYKGRVSRVLPGMQSAFVDIGLDRDAFLYVSDFFEDAEEYDKIVAEAEARVIRFAEVAQTAAQPAELPAIEPPADLPPVETPGLPVPPSPEVMVARPPEYQPAPPVVTSPPAPMAPPNSAPSGGSPRSYDKPAGPPSDFRRGEHRGRRRRRHGPPSFGERKFGPKPELRDRPAERPSAPDAGPGSNFEVLPGESLAKHRHGTAQSSSPAAAFDAPHKTSVEEVTPFESAMAEPEVQDAESSIETTSNYIAPASSAFVLEEKPASEISASPLATNEPAPAIEDFPAPAPPVNLLSNVEGSFSSGAETAATPKTHAAPVSERAPTVLPTKADEPNPETKPRPLWDRLVSTVLGKPHNPSDAQKARDNDAAVPSERTPASTPYDLETPDAGHTGLDPEDFPVAPEAPSIDPGIIFAPDGAGTDEAISEASTPGQIPSLTPGEPANREYTLREPNQKPRFAPRRRGRQGRGNRDFTPASGPAPRRESPRAGNHQPLQIAELLKEGQEILVQIAKEPLGRKGARITSHIALPGRYLVYMPTVDHMGVSRKIASEEERLRLKNILRDNKDQVAGGFIARTAGAGRSEEELKADMKFLSSLWSDIRSKAEGTKAPALLHRDLDLMQRILRDILSPDFKTVRVDNEIEYERALEFVSRCQPSLVDHVKLYTRDTPMFEEFGIQAEIDKALKSKVWLKSGGYIVINQTEALVAIDVNTGKYVGKTNRLEDTIVKTNIDAVKEIVRQIRLRDLGGIIVIDFIDMDERRNRNKVVQALEEALRFDRAPTKILSFNDFGLVALTRKRVKQSLERTLCEPCSYCSGSGYIKSVTTLCYEILAEARKMAAEHEGESLTLRVHPEVARALKSREGVVLSELEAITKKDVIIKSDASVHQERFEIY